MAGKGKKRKIDAGDVATNRKARFNYEFIEKYEAGIALTGSEVKSVRDGKALINDAYAAVEDGEVVLRGAHIAPYGPATINNHEPDRPRRLLLHRYEIERLIGATQRKGLTLIPTRIYLKGRHVKVELALARGKEKGDKRDAIRDRDVKRDVERELRDSRR